MVFDDLEYRGFVAAHLFRESYAPLDVAFHLLEFFGAERPSPIQKVMRHGRFSQILQAAGPKNLLLNLAGKIHSFRQGIGKGGDNLRVAERPVDTFMRQDQLVR